jgi:acyl dehydratase
MTEVFLDDLEVGQRYELGTRVVRREEIVAFARDYDPQPFHVDESIARSSIYGGLIASGWHTVCLFMRLFVDGFLQRAASMGSPGVDELRWLKPVRPDDRLGGHIEILEIRPSRSRPNRGIVRMRCSMLNQDGEEVLSMIANVMLHRSEEAGP